MGDNVIAQIIEKIQEVPAMYITPEQEKLLLEKEKKGQKITKQQHKYPGFYTYIVEDYISFVADDDLDDEDTLYDGVIKLIMVACIEAKIPAFCIHRYNEKDKLIQLSLHPILKSLQLGDVKVLCQEKHIRHIHCAILPYHKIKNLC